MKRCRSALHKDTRELSIDKFSKRKSAKDGLRHKCKECERIYKQINVWTRMVNHSRSDDKKAGRIISDGLYITKEYLQEEYKNLNGLCYWCDTKMVFGKGIKRQTNGHAMQPERLDPRLGHEKKKTTLCCKDCNRQSKDRQPEEMILFAKELKANTIKHCYGPLHTEEEFDSFLPIDQFYKNKSICKKCKKHEGVIYRAKKKIEKK